MPMDCKAIKASDGKLYLMDLMHTSPRDANFPDDDSAVVRHEFVRRWCQERAVQRALEQQTGAAPSPMLPVADIERYADEIRIDINALTRYGIAPESVSGDQPQQQSVGDVAPLGRWSELTRVLSRRPGCRCDGGVVAERHGARCGAGHPVPVDCAHRLPRHGVPVPRVRPEHAVPGPRVPPGGVGRRRPERPAHVDALRHAPDAHGRARQQARAGAPDPPRGAVRRRCLVRGRLLQPAAPAAGSEAGPGHVGRTRRRCPPALLAPAPRPAHPFRQPVVRRLQRLPRCVCACHCRSAWARTC